MKKTLVIENNMDYVTAIFFLLAGGLVGSLIVIFLLFPYKSGQKDDDELIKNIKMSITQNEETFINHIQEKSSLQFENLSNKIFEHSIQKLREESKEILFPLKEEIEKFEKKLDDSFSTQSKETHTLKFEIERIAKISEKMTSETINLTKALKGDAKTQGAWGELVLEKLLEESGLREGHEYIRQGINAKFVNPDTGFNLKPDIMICLPEGKCVIVDSKVSLTNYEDYYSEKDQNLRISHLKKFLNSVKNHINCLDQRCYQDCNEGKMLDFVLMFMPIESAFVLAIQQDKELYNYAWSKRVIIVCPSTLFAILTVIKLIWRQQLQTKHVYDIAKQGGLLHDKIFNFISEMQEIERNLNNTLDSYHHAMNKLSYGRGSVLSRTQKLRDLGAKTTKDLRKLIPEAFDELDNDLENTKKIEKTKE